MSIVVRRQSLYRGIVLASRLCGGRQWSGLIMRIFGVSSASTGVLTLHCEASHPDESGNFPLFLATMIRSLLVSE
jgi:hypothetical protein